MEEKINQKPCVVQKIETPQGFSVSYKEHLLYSKYNPSKNIITAVERLQLLPDTIILCCSPLLGYGITELLAKLPENCLIVLCEAERALYDFSDEQGWLNFSDNRILKCAPDKLSDLPLTLYDLVRRCLYKRVIRIDLSAGTQFHKDFYDQLFAASTDSVMTFWKNRITLTRFGRRYSKNLFENLHYLAESEPITNYFQAVEKPIIVFGAGESTQTFLNKYKNLISNYFVLCADTALQPLLKNGIKADGVFVEEAQSVIVKAFTGIPDDIHIFAGLSSIPNLVHKYGAKNLSYFFTEYTKADFLDNLKSKSFMPPANKPFGSVGLTAVYYALKFRKDDSIPVYVTGLDFSYSPGVTHTKGALAHLLRLISANRIQSIGNYGAAFGNSTEKIIGKDGKYCITTPVLKSYSLMFKGIFGQTKNLFDLGISGVDLGLQKVDCFEADAPRNDKHLNDTFISYHSEVEDRRNLYNQEIEKNLGSEKEALQNLRDLLTGKTELKDQTLLDEIEKLAKPREYLYLHFADGAQFSTNQSFLNRIRTEIDYFLKYL